MLRAQDGTVGNRGPDRLGHGDAVARCPVRKLSGSEVPLLSVAEQAGACRPFGAEDRQGVSCRHGPGRTDGRVVEKREEFNAFVTRNVAPFAEQWDRDQQVPAGVISQMAQAGYLGCSLPPEYGGQGWDIVTFGLLNEAFGRASSALTGV